MMSGKFLPISLVLLGLLVAFSECLHFKISRRDKHGMQGSPPPSPTNDPLPPDQWFTQLLDHFEPTTTTTWKQVSFIEHERCANQSLGKLRCFESRRWLKIKAIKYCSSLKKQNFTVSSKSS